MLANDLASGRAIKERQLAMFQERDHEFLERCRRTALEIARRQLTVSINDVRKFVDVPPGIHPSVLGAVFKDKRFKAVGYTEATHTAAHGRVVRVYQINNTKE